MTVTIFVLLATVLQAQARRPAPAAPVQNETLGVQVMLDRAGFSPGVLDGQMGRNTQKALDAYTRNGGNPLPAADPLLQYAITAEDAAGPFIPDLPADLMAQSKLPALGYRTLLEALAERFHCAPALLQRLNRAAQFVAGETIAVPNVDPLILPIERLSPAPSPAPAGRAGASSAAPAAPPVDKPVKPDVTLSVSKSLGALTVTDASGRVVFYAPVTTGSEHDPLPLGEWRVNGVQFDPTFRYNPALFWDADPTQAKATIPAGPNNPVGVVWVDLSKEHYGLHGTPEPALIGRVESHGCVRLTNWDALKVAALVKPGTRVLFTE